MTVRKLRWSYFAAGLFVVTLKGSQLLFCTPMSVHPSYSAAPPDPFQAYDTTPLADYCGLSPAQMHQLLFHPLEPGGVVRLRTEVPNEVLD